ncbi:hypothetical protein EVAR_49272_1 [Eumeta japonica]|uniref:Uncharacterized protein n=1 Tax=Eumeta variegata TaxID=151549 RepID=A0A4C1YJ75_EUMVA|nr:hypothetical protein EVAR_49272_1 [Eumeta japonica]
MADCERGAHLSQVAGSYSKFTHSIDRKTFCLNCPCTTLTRHGNLIGPKCFFTNSFPGSSLHYYRRLAFVFDVRCDRRLVPEEEFRSSSKPRIFCFISDLNYGRPPMTTNAAPVSTYHILLSIALKINGYTNNSKRAIATTTKQHFGEKENAKCRTRLADVLLPSTYLAARWIHQGRTM